MTVDQPTGYKAPAINKAFRLLRTVAQSPQGFGINELAEKLGYSKSSTHGLVHALLRENALIQSPGSRKLYLGPAMAELVFSNWDQEKMKELAQPVLNDIRDKVQETVFLGFRIRNRVQITVAAEAYQALKISVPVGSTIPLLAGAVGKVFLAEEKKEAVIALISQQGLPRYTPRSTTDVHDYLAELDRVRTQGYALDTEEYITGVRAVAVALKNRRGLPAAVWVVGISGNMDGEKIQQIAIITSAAAEDLRHILDEDT